VYGVFVFVQTRRLRWMFLSPTDDELPGDETVIETDRIALDADVAEQEAVPAGGPSMTVLCLLLLASLVGVIGFAKLLAHSIEDLVVWAGAPPSFVGVVIAMMVLLPESVSAFRAASRGEMQTSLNLALGSAMASIGLTIPAIAIASIWLDGPITLGLGSKEIVLLVITAVVSILTFGSGRATVLQATHHLTVFATFLFLSWNP
jgi:Ca2+:H+ antiporter